jgi:hypothetical protein
MWLVAATGIVTLLVVLVTRGHFSALTGLRFSGTPILLVGLAIQAALEYIQVPKREITTLGYGLLMCSYVLILAFCITNLSLRGFGVIAFGVALNALVIGLNLGMPTKPIGNDAHGNRVFKPVEQTVKHRQSRGDDLLGFLGDRILFPKPFDTIVSFGDLIIAVGVCELCYYATRKWPHGVLPTDRRPPA